VFGEPASFAPARDADSSAALNAAELSALGLESADAGVDTSFKFGGFADFTSYFPIKARGATAIGLPTTQTFYIGSANLYISKRLSEDFRMMGEVRLSYLPNGALAINQGGFNYLSTEVADYADNSRVQRWGGIILQRVYLEWSLHRLAVLRLGQFLTPYGIWNVDHASPVYIPVQRPYAANSNYFPERQTGLELYGRWDPSNRSTLGYHLTFSNGAGPVSEYRDLDSNKAIGARLYWEHNDPGFFRLGVSAYYGRETTSSPRVDVDPTSIAVGADISSQFDALSLGADILFVLHHVHFQAEIASQQRNYTEEGRVARVEYFAPVGMGFPSDSLSWAVYGLLGYTLPWYSLTPYVMLQHSREVLGLPIPDYILSNGVVQVGLNMRPIDAVVFKAEAGRSVFFNGGPVLKYPVNFVQLQAAWAF